MTYGTGIEMCVWVSFKRWRIRAYAYVSRVEGLTGATHRKEEGETRMDRALKFVQVC